MSDADGGWIYVCESRIQDESNRVVVPETLLTEANILTAGEDAAWAYDRSGLVVVSNRKLVDGRYKHIGTNGIDPSQHTTWVPGRFFDDFAGHRGPIEESNTTYEPRFDYGQPVFFAYRAGMADGDTRSVYFLTREQLTDIMDGQDFSDSFDTIPRFLG